jgi:hypothetical protein
MPREWNTPHREKWTAPIHQILKAIDNHTRLYIETGDVWHEEQAQILRKYIKDVKVWIHKEEELGIMKKIIAALGNIIIHGTSSQC